MRFALKLILALSFASLGSSAISCTTCDQEKKSGDRNSEKVRIESGCYTYSAHDDPKHQGSILVLQYYFDAVQNSIVGAFAQANEGPKKTPLILKEARFDDENNPEADDFEITWLQVEKNRVSGSYTLVQTGSGARPGRYLVYQNFRSKRKYLLSRAGEARECKALFNRWNTKESPLRELD